MQTHHTDERLLPLGESQLVRIEPTESEALVPGQAPASQESIEDCFPTRSVRVSQHKEAPHESFEVQGGDRDRRGGRNR